MSPRPAALTVSQYTGKADDGGEPCCDGHHAVMYVPEGAAYEVGEYRCAWSGSAEGFHHRRASCGADPNTSRLLHSLRVQWHRDNPA